MSSRRGHDPFTMTLRMRVVFGPGVLNVLMGFPILIQPNACINGLSDPIQPNACNPPISNN